MREAIDDATLTSYALGELSDAERAAVEARLAESEALRAELREIEAAAELVRQAYVLAPEHLLRREQRDAIEAAALRDRPARLAARRAWLTIGLPAAAAVLLAVGLWVLGAGGWGRPQPPRVATAERTVPVTPAPPTTTAAGRPAAAPAAPPVLVADVVPAQATPAAPPRQLAAAPLQGVASAGPLASTIRGTATDPSGAVVPGARVTLTNDATGVGFTATTNALGNYEFGVPAGSYRLMVELAGFQPAVLPKITTRAADVRVANVTLASGMLAETVTVVADASSAKRSAAEAAGSIVGEKVVELPLNGRSFQQLALVKPEMDQVHEFKVQRPAPPPAPMGGVPDALRRSSAEFTTEAYDSIRDNPFIRVATDPRSTFSVDVDTASYSNVRRFLNQGRLPPKDAVRIEELLNYFSYDYAPPRGRHPFAVHMETAACPWQPKHRLVRIGIKGRELQGERPPANVVFLVDVSGSMRDANKLPLVKEALELLVDQLKERDRIAIVVYAGAEGLALPSTPGSDKQTIRAALDSFSAGGTTHGSAGLRLAYQVAEAHLLKGGVNRIVLATDGDFNVGVTSQGDLVRLIEEKARSGVFLTALGFGMGNYKDSTLEKLADHGNGNYAYIDTLREARKVLVEQLAGTLVTIAKDVKLQLEWNPANVEAFRLIGYENRVLAHQDFNDDRKDAGDIGAGHTVTALYEVVPAGVAIDVPGVDSLKYQRAPRGNGRAKSRELLTLKLRYKQPDGDRSRLLERTLDDSTARFESASRDFRFAAAVASFGMVLRDSPYKGTASVDAVLAWAGTSRGPDQQGWRREFLDLVEKAGELLHGEPHDRE